MVKLRTTNIVGSANKQSWSQAQVFSIIDSGKGLVVIRLSTQEEDSLVDLATVGAEILVDLESKANASTTKLSLEQLVKSLTEEIAEGIELEILIAVIKNSKLTVYGDGMVEAYLVRDGKLALLQAPLDNKREISGMLERGDVLFLSTSKLVELVGIKKLKAILSEDDNPDELLAPLIHTQADSSGFGAIVASLVDDESPREKTSFWKIFSRNNIKISLSNNEPKKSNLLIGGIIFLLLVIMIGVGVIRRNSQLAETEFETLASSVEQSISEASSIGDINTERARVLLTQARGEVEAYLVIESLRDEYRIRAQDLIKYIDSADEQIFKKNEVKLTTLVDLSILVDGLSASKMKSDGRESLVFVDDSNNNLVALNIVDRSRQILETGQSDIADVGLSETKAYGLGEEGVFEYLWKGNSGKQVVEGDEFWVEPFLIEMFAGNIYVLDKSQSEIWKYSTLGDSKFGGRNRWLAATITPDLSNVVDMKISGDIWLLTSTGKLERYSRGAPVSFSMEGFPSKGEAKRFVDPRAVWATENTIYVLESGASRIVLFGDDGKYQAQYLSSEFERATDLVIVDDKGYVLIDNAVKTFGL